MNHVMKKRGVPDIASGTPPRSVCGILCGQQKSVKSYSFKKLQKAKENTRNPKISGVVLELLGGFEQPTSSLPNIYRLLFLVVPFCFLFSESIGITCVCRFLCRFLLSAVALYLLRFFDDCCGFVAVSIEPPFLAHL